MRRFLENRDLLASAGGAIVGTVALHQWPFPDQSALLGFIHGNAAWVFYGIKISYLAMLFSTPWIAFSVLLSSTYIFTLRTWRTGGFAKLPPYPDPTERTELFLVIGEVHHPKRPQAVEEPRWLVIPSRGLYTGIGIFGAIGSGKTSGCMYPFAEQLLTLPGRRSTETDRWLGA